MLTTAHHPAFRTVIRMVTCVDKTVKMAMGRMASLTWLPFHGGVAVDGAAALEVHVGV